MLAIFLDRVAVPSGLLRLADLDTVSVTNIPQHFPLPEPPAIVGVSVIPEPHFVKRLVLCVADFKTPAVMSERDIVYVQMGRCFIEVHHRIEHIEVRIFRLKSLHIFTQAFSSFFSIGSSDSRIIFRANVDEMFIETFLLVRSLDHALAWRTVEQVFKVVTDLAVTSFLTGVVSFYRFVKKLVVGFAQVLLNEHDVIWRPEWVDILGSELSVIM